MSIIYFDWIKPDDKDIERAESCTSEAKALAQINAITDPDKLLRRAVAFATAGTYGTNANLWAKRAKELGIPDKKILDMYETIINIQCNVAENDLNVVSPNILNDEEIQSTSTATPTDPEKTVWYIVVSETDKAGVYEYFHITRDQFKVLGPAKEPEKYTLVDWDGWVCCILEIVEGLSNAEKWEEDNRSLLTDLQILSTAPQEVRSTFGLPEVTKKTGRVILTRDSDNKLVVTSTEDMSSDIYDKAIVLDVFENRDDAEITTLIKKALANLNNLEVTDNELVDLLEKRYSVDRGRIVETLGLDAEKEDNGTLQKIQELRSIRLSYDSYSNKLTDEFEEFVEVYMDMYKIIKRLPRIESGKSGMVRTAVDTIKDLPLDVKEPLRKFVDYCRTNVTLNSMCWEVAEELAYHLSDSKDKNWDNRSLILKNRDELRISLTDHSMDYIDMMDIDPFYSQREYENDDDLRSKVRSTFRCLKETMRYEDYANMISNAIQTSLEEKGVDNQQCYEGLPDGQYLIGFDIFGVSKGAFLVVELKVGTLPDSFDLTVRNASDLSSYRGNCSPESLVTHDEDTGIFWVGEGTFYSKIKDFSHTENIRLD